MTKDTARPGAFQNQMTGNFCFGCGADNHQGLQIKSHWLEGSPREAVCFFQPEPRHAAGPRHFLNGGIIATIIDCHAVCTAAAEARQRDSEPDLWYATASLNVKYVRPTPLGEDPVEVRAKIEHVDEGKTRLSCVLIAGGKECVLAEVEAVRVPSSWSRPRPLDG